MEISSERESPVGPVTIQEEVKSMPIGSSSVPKKKRKGHKPSSLALQKRKTKKYTREAEGTVKTGPLSSVVVESTAQAGVSIKEIPRYIPLSWLGVKARNPLKIKSTR